MSAAAWPVVTGEIADRIRTHDWGETPLGATGDWPQSLRTILDFVLGSETVMVVVWGEEQLLLYNDAYSRLIGERSAHALGRPVFDALPELRPILEPQFAGVMAGNAVTLSDQLCPFVRHGVVEDAWFDVSHTPLRDERGAVAGILTILAETTGRIEAQRRSEAADTALRASGERQTFLLELNDRMREAGDAEAVIATATRMLGEELEASRIVFAEIDEAAGVANIRPGWTADGAEAHPAILKLADFGGPLLDDLRAGRTVRYDDVGAPPYARTDLAALAAIGIGAGLSVPLLIGGRFVVNLNVHQHEPRRWTDGEVTLAEEVAERIWAAVQRVRAEAALRESEEKHRTLLETMGQGYCELELVRDADGRAVDQLYLEFNPAYERLIGIPVAEAKGRTASEVMPGLEPWWTEAFDRIAESGQPERIEHQVASMDRWFEVWVYPRGDDRLTVLYEDITERKRAEEIQRQSEERQTFLLKLSDALRAESGVEAVGDRAVRMIAERLELDRAYLVTVNTRDDSILITHEVGQEEMPPLLGSYRGSDFPNAMKEIFERTIVFEDVRTDARLSETDRQSFTGLGAVGFVGVPIRRGSDEMIWAAGAISTRPRTWTTGEVALLEDAVERTWAAVERARAEEKLRESEARLSAIFAYAPVGLSEITPEGRFVAVNEKMCRITGRTRAELLMLGVADVSHPDDVNRSLVVVEEVLETGEARALDKRYRRPDGASVWANSIALLLPPNHHEPKSLIVVTTDLTARRRAEEVLRESEERFCQFGEASSDVLWIRGADALQWEYLSAAFTTVYGQDRDEALTGNDLRRWVEMIVPEDRESALANIRRVRDGERITFEYRIRRPSDGQIRWVRNTDFPLLDAAGTVQRIGGIGHDATEEKEMTERLHVLIAELQHRTRNLIAVVQSLAQKTLKESDSLNDFQARYSDRLQAVSRVQELLSRLREGRKITFDELLKAELTAFGVVDGDAKRVTLDGPDGVRLRSTTVQTFALALHELATNAVKYGALASPEGHLSVRWRVEGDGAGSQIHVEWRESGVIGARSAAPRGGGYGRELIERALPYQLNAKTHYEIGPDGVHCTIRVPISDAEAVGQNGDD